jgi:hypothetical protein
MIRTIPEETAVWPGAVRFSTGKTGVTPEQGSERPFFLAFSHGFDL